MKKSKINKIVIFTQPAGKLTIVDMECFFNYELRVLQGRRQKEFAFI